MAALITLAMAKAQCRIADQLTDYDEDLDQKRQQATDIVLDYLKREEPDWTLDLPGSPSSLSPASPSANRELSIIQAAIMEVTANLFFHRGDADATGPITKRVENMLMRLRDPALA